MNDKKYNNINKMYVILYFTAQAADGKVSKESVVLTLSEFKVK